MNYLNAAPSKLFAAFASATITTVVTASITFGMAGLPTQGNTPLMAAAAAHASVRG